MIALVPATLADSAALHRMQVEAFAPLLARYQDDDTNPGAEGEDKVIARLQYEGSQYYFIHADGQPVGALRVVCHGADTCRLSQVFVLPAYQGHGYAQQALQMAEALYPQARRWQLDTIAQEAKLCHLYEKLGYQKTGRETPLGPHMTLIDYEKVIAQE